LLVGLKDCGTGGRASAAAVTASMLWIEREWWPPKAATSQFDAFLKILIVD